MDNKNDNENEYFDNMVSKAIDNIPSPYIEKISNLHFKIEDTPTNEQREKLGLRSCDARPVSHKPRYKADSSRGDAEDSFSEEGVPVGTAKSETELMDSPGESDLARIWCEPGLFGLYEGVPLTKRGGAVHSIVPDVITIFRHPMMDFISNEDMLAKQIHETVWHEVAHYFGLDHDQIHKLHLRKTSPSPDSSG